MVCSPYISETTPTLRLAAKRCVAVVRRCYSMSSDVKCLSAKAGSNTDTEIPICGCKSVVRFLFQILVGRLSWLTLIVVFLSPCVSCCCRPAVWCCSGCRSAPSPLWTALPLDCCAWRLYVTACAPHRVSMPQTRTTRRPHCRRLGTERRTAARVSLCIDKCVACSSARVRPLLSASCGSYCH